MIDVKINDRELAAKLSEIGRQMPFAQSLAINRVAFIVRRGLLANMKSTLDRPTPYTQRSLFVTKGTVAKPDARVWFADHASVSNAVPAERYLLPNVNGGGRHAKSTEKYLRGAGILPDNEFIAPAAGAILDQYGNLPAGKIAQMRAALKINPVRSGYQANQTKKSRSRNRKRDDFYVIKSKSGKNVGVSIRQFGGSSLPFIRFVRSPKYSKRFDFYGVAERNVAINLPGELSRAIEYALRTAK